MQSWRDYTSGTGRRECRHRHRRRRRRRRRKWQAWVRRNAAGIAALDVKFTYRAAMLAAARNIAAGLHTKVRSKITAFEGES